MCAVQRLLVLALIVNSGCNVLFQLEHVGVPAPEPDAAGCGTPDEDGDCVGDDVDVCPGLADASQSDDGDADGVGNVCDPNRAVAHRIAHFTGFGDPAAAMAAWATLGTSWTFEPGSAVHPSVTAGGELQYTSIDDAPEVAVETGFTFDAWEVVDTSVPRLGVWIDSSTLGTDGHACVLTSYSSVSGQDTLSLTDATGAARAADVAEIQPGARVVLVFDRARTPDTLRCRLLVDEHEVASVTYPATNPWPVSGRVGVTASHASASVRYVAVYAAP